MLTYEQMERIEQAKENQRVALPVYCGFEEEELLSA